jgi:hypothetical protein
MKKVSVAIMVLLVFASVAHATKLQGKIGIGGAVSDTASVFSVKSFFTNNFVGALNFNYSTQSNNTNSLILGANVGYANEIIKSTILEVGGGFSLLSGQQAGTGYSGFAVSLGAEIEYLLNEHLGISLSVQPLAFQSATAAGNTTTTFGVGTAGVAGHYYF